MVATPNQAKSVIIRADDGRRIKLRCPVCGDETWMQGHGAKDVEEFHPVLVATTSNKGLVSVKVMQFFCGNCSFSMQFADIDTVTVEDISQ